MVKKFWIGQTLLIVLLSISINCSGNKSQKLLKICAPKGIENWERAQVLTKIDKYIKQGANVNAIDKLGESPLHKISNYPEGKYYIDILLKNGANVNIKNNNGKTPLQLAVTNRGGYEMMEKLIKYGADVNAVDDSGRTALINLVLISDSEIFQQMKNGFEARFWLLMENNADAKIKDNFQKTAADYCQELKINTYSRLLSIEPNLYHENIDYLYNVFQRYLSYDQNYLLAMQSCDTDEMKKWLDKGANIDLVISRDYLFDCSTDILDKLIVYGFDLNYYGKKLLLQSIKAGKIEFVRYLTEKGVKINEEMISLVNSHEYLILNSGSAPQIKNIINIIDESTEGYAERASARERTIFFTNLKKTIIWIIISIVGIIIFIAALPNIKSQLSDAGKYAKCSNCHSKLHGYEKECPNCGARLYS